MTAAAALQFLEIERKRIEAEYAAAVSVIRQSTLPHARLVIDSYFEVRLDANARAMDALRRDPKDD